jgi:precorrin-2 dehydrogenase/sirohydrochlorin ferrochelatase
MREHYFPAFLDLRGRRAVVVGGGEVARGKVLGLLPCGADVCVVSPEAHPDLHRLAQRGHLRWEARRYVPGDLRDAFLAVAATDEPELNDAVYREAVAERVLINVVDVPDRCQFVYGAVMRRGRLIAAISTGGSAPAHAAALKRDLAAHWGPEQGQLVSAYRRLRPLVARRIPTVAERRRFWLDLVGRNPALPLLRAGRGREVDGLLAAEVEAWAAGHREPAAPPAAAGGAR